MTTVTRRLKRSGDGGALDSSWGVALWIIAIAAILFILDFGSAILLPTAYAIILALVLAPVARGLSYLRMGDGISAVLTVAMAAAGIVAVIAFVAPAIGDWLDDMPKMARAIERKLQPIKEQIELVESASNRISGTQGAAAPAPSGEGVSGWLFATGANIASQMIYVIFLTLFLLALRTDLRRRFILASNTTDGRIRIARAVRDIGRNVTAYLFILTCINGGVAVVTTIAFYVADIPNALVWGVVYGLACYIPVVGPTATILASAVVGMATQATLLEGMIGPAILLVINMIESQFIQPVLMARRIDLNPIALFVSLAFVVWLWGVPAAIIAAPLLIVIYTFSKHTPALQPIAAALAPVTKPKHAPPLPTLVARRRAAQERKALARV